MITALYAGILAVLMVILLFRVIRMRLKYKVGLGDGGISELTQAIRVHGNFTEMVPLLLILMMVMEIGDISATFLHSFGIAIVLSRIFHIIGLSQSSGTTKGRFIGTVIAITLLLIGGLTCIYTFSM